MQAQLPVYSDTMARLISTITKPLYISLPTFLVLELTTAPTIMMGFLWFLVTTLGCFAIPWLYVTRNVRLGKYSDRNVSVREERIKPMLIAFICVLITFSSLVLFHASKTLLAALTAVIVSGLLALFITKHWKISLHLMGISGSVMTFIFAFGPFFLILTPAILLVAWARYHIRAHTLAQIIAGSLLSICITRLVFYLFFSLV
jgi:hypothetical protein